MKQSEADFEEDLVSKVITDVMEVQLEKIIVENVDSYGYTIVDEIMKELLKLKKLFKYAVTVFIQQKCGCAMNYGNSIYVDDSSDGTVTAVITTHPSLDILINISGFKISGSK